MRREFRDFRLWILDFRLGLDDFRFITAFASKFNLTGFMYSDKETGFLAPSTHHNEELSKKPGSRPPA